VNSQARFLCTIIAHPVTRQATPSVPDIRARRAMAVCPTRNVEAVIMEPKSEISAAAAN
jgi:hypothetical protein